MTDIIKHGSSCLFAVCIASITITSLLLGHDGATVYTGMGLIGGLGGLHSYVSGKDGSSGSGSASA